MQRQRYRLFRRKNGTYYSFKNDNGRKTSLLPKIGAKPLSVDESLQQVDEQLRAKPLQVKEQHPSRSRN